MKKMVATNKQRVYHYNGNKILPNEIFNVRDEHIVLLTALGWVKDMPPVKAMTAENTPALIPTPVRGDSHTQHSIEYAVVAAQREGDVEIGAGVVALDPEPTFEIGESQSENTNETKTNETNISETNEASNDALLMTDSTESLTQTVKEDEENLVVQSQEYSKMLRERAISLGIKIDGRWSDTRVQREIDEYNAKTYQRMDMRASK